MRSFYGLQFLKKYIRRGYAEKNSENGGDIVERYSSVVFYRRDDGRDHFRDDLSANL